MGLWKGCWGTGRFPHVLEKKGAAGGKHGFPREREPQASVARVTLYRAAGCTLCERALEVVRDARQELAFELQIVDIDDDPALEGAYREDLPVVEIDGVRAFRYFVEPGAFRARLSRGA
jgi:glutaredoxin